MLSNPYWATALFVLCYMIFWFIIAQLQKDNSIVDVAWGLGFVGIAWLVQLQYADAFLWSTLLVSLWGLRLGIYLGIRYYKTAKEDWRYVNMRNSWKGNIMIQSFLRVFLLQGVLMWLVASPIIQTSFGVKGADLLLIPGVALFTIGWLWQSIADWQLYHFKLQKENKGKILKTGLWKLSRHPNYFGEILVWWGIFLATLHYGQWYISLLGPVLITFLLMRVSGVTMLEAKMKKRPEYAEYIKSTNALFPRLF